MSDRSGRSSKKKRATTTARRNRKRAADLKRPFDPALLKRARAITRKYRLVLSPDKDLGWVGTAVEMPHVYADGRTPDACVREIGEALTSAVATLLELSRRPPEAAERTMQVNVRLTAEEKMLLGSTASRHGFRSVSDLVRTAALSWSVDRNGP